jgi:hypothetical protein
VIRQKQQEIIHMFWWVTSVSFRPDYTAVSWERMEAYLQAINFPPPSSKLTDFVFDVLKYRDAWKEAGADVDKSIGTAPRGPFTSVVDHVLLSPFLKRG